MTWFGPKAPGRRPKYLDRPLTGAERSRIARLRRKGVTVPVRDPLAGIRAALAVYRSAVGSGTGKDEAAMEVIRQLTHYLGEHDGY